MFIFAINITYYMVLQYVHRLGLSLDTISHNKYLYKVIVFHIQHNVFHLSYTNISYYR